MPTGSFEYLTFGVNRARVAAFGGASGVNPTWHEIPLTKEGTLKITISKAEVVDGEGDIAYVWRHSQRCTVDMMAAKYSMKILEVVSGNTASSAAGVEGIYFGTSGEIAPPICILELSCVATDSSAASPTRVYETVYLYKCQAKWPDLEFKATKEGEMQIMFDAYKSTKDELGRTIPEAFGMVKAGSASLPA